MWKATTTLGVLAILAAIASGCFRTAIYDSEVEPGHTPVDYDSRWHHGFILGIVEIGGYRLDEICPGGWSDIEVNTSALNGFVEIVTQTLYNPQSVTVTCVAGGEVYELDLEGAGRVSGGGARE